METLGSYIVTGLAIYGGIKLLGLDDKVRNLSRAIIQHYRTSADRLQGQDVRSLLDDERILTDGHMQISIVCVDNTKTGGHAFLLFERKDPNGNWALFNRADFCFNGELCNNSFVATSQLCGCVGGVVITVTDTTLDVDQAQTWLRGGGKHASFTFMHEYRTEQEVEAKIKGLKASEGLFTYSLAGDHSATSSVNSRRNNQNCATWCAYVLEHDFGIDIKLHSRFMNFVRSPAFVVQQALIAVAPETPVQAN